MCELVLGINYFGHDSSIALVDMTGQVLYCLTEERYSNIKHDGGYPVGAIREINRLIDEEELGSIRYIAINNDPQLFITEKLKLFLFSNLNSGAASAVYEFIFKISLNTMISGENSYPLNYIKDLLLSYKVDVVKIDDTLRFIRWCINRFVFFNERKIRISELFKNCEVISVNHHKSHAASAFYMSGFESAAIMTIDGYGENDTITLGRGEGNKLFMSSCSVWPNSLGLLYSMITEFLGFSWFGDEYKVMGMAAYGNPTYLELFSELGYVDNTGCFNFKAGRFLYKNEMYGAPGEYLMEFTPLFIKMLGGKKSKSTEFTQGHFDIAASLQKFVENIGVLMAKSLKQLHPELNKLCIAGGVGLNGLMNERILKNAGFESIFIQPASSDDGTALGAALSVISEKYINANFSKLNNYFLGKEYDNSHIEEVLTVKGICYSRDNNITRKVAELLADGNVVARYIGRSEFGPRALGHRSIMASPLSAEMKDIINARIKHREPFRPFAPACVAESVHQYFDVKNDAEYMLLICSVNAAMRKVIPAVVHNDGTARVQVVHADRNPDFHQIIECFKELTGVPVVINTSFNVNGETIVETPQDALECFLYTDIDYLAIGDFLVSKSENEHHRILLQSEDFLKIRKQRYLDQSWTPELYWDKYLGDICISDSDLLHQRKRIALREKSLLIVQFLQQNFISAICVVGAGDIAKIMLPVLENYIPVKWLSDKNYKSIKGFNLPILPISEVIDAGCRCFIIASDAFEYEIKSDINSMAVEMGLDVNIIGLSDVSIS